MKEVLKNLQNVLCAFGKAVRTHRPAYDNLEYPHISLK
jgi:hypothetical protein